MYVVDMIINKDMSQSEENKELMGRIVKPKNVEVNAPAVLEYVDGSGAMKTLEDVEAIQMQNDMVLIITETLFIRLRSGLDV